MFHMKHCTAAKRNRAAVEHPNVSCETFPHPLHLVPRGQTTTSGAQSTQSGAAHTARACRTCLCRPSESPVAIDGSGAFRRCGNAFPPRGSFGKAETPVRALAAKRQTGVANAPRIRRSARRIISIYNNEENRAKFARKPRENLPLPPAFPRRFSAVKHARETYGRRADFRVVGTGKCRRLCRKLPAKPAFSARESKKIFARKKVCFRTAYI